MQNMYNRLSPEAKELLDSSAMDRHDFGQIINKVLINWCRNGGSLEEFYEEFERHPLRASFPPKLGNYRNVVRKAYYSAEEFTERCRDPLALQERLIELRGRVAEWDLDGERRYRRPRETWLVMLDILIQDCQSDWNRGYRRLAVEAGLGSQVTARKHAQAALEIDLLRDQTPELSPEELAKGTPRPVSRLAFNLDWGVEDLLGLPIREEDIQGKKLNNTTRYIPIECVVQFLSLFSSDAWTHSLGLNRKRTYEGLSEAPAKVSEIAAATEQSAPTVRDHLEYLVDKGVVIKEPARKGRGYEYRINPEPDTEQIEAEAAYWKAESVEKFERQRADFNAYSTVWLRFYEHPAGNYPMISDGDKPYRLNRDGLEYAQGKQKAWEHHQIPEQFREYTEEGVPLRGLWVIPEGEVIEVTQGPPPVHAVWFDLLEEDRPVQLLKFNPWDVRLNKVPTMDLVNAPASDPFKDLDRDPEPAPAAMTVMDYIGEPDF